MRVYLLLDPPFVGYLDQHSLHLNVTEGLARLGRLGLNYSPLFLQFDYQIGQQEMWSLPSIGQMKYLVWPLTCFVGQLGESEPFRAVPAVLPVLSWLGWPEIIVRRQA